MNYSLIDQDDQLADVCQKARQHAAVALDTEFVRTRTYYPQLGLIQLFDDQQLVLIDPLNIRDWSPFIDLLTDTSVTKFLHAGGEDLEVFLHRFGVLPTPMIDTQILAAFSGQPLSWGFASMVAHFTQVELDKSESRTDWLARPLTQRQCEYAAADVHYLLPIARQLMINSKQLQANIDVQKTALAQAQSDLNRRVPLGTANLIGREELQHARDAVASAQAQLDVAIQQYNANQAMILGTSLENQPAVQQAATEVRNAWLALQRTKIVSPMTGYVSRRSVQPGAQISPTTPLMAVVPADNLWVDANFKETQLAHMRIGQTATVISDIYGDDVKYTGKVVGLDMGTGSAFSLLPAQNATGNWIKVVQRLPVRIELDPKQLADHPLRIGLSTLVTVDTANRDGQILASQVRSTPAYESNAREISLDPVNKLIDDIVKANAG